MKYPVIIAPTPTGYSAHVPDLPGCIATGKTREQTREHIAEALSLHIGAMRRDRDPIPDPSIVELIEVG